MTGPFGLFIHPDTGTVQVCVALDLELKIPYRMVTPDAARCFANNAMISIRLETQSLVSVTVASKFKPGTTSAR